ncbi:hypothetical protein SteCoe_3135 [Stentor coeruleus]|uniref:Uncharacterized protein n=1 Tax=Stentor coeruleus TaxID=5963 RepID=A0A1R2CXT7_9CILI|nr:hypothetical protein SteCoe_3135 [Stentor coeruleus]
MIVSLVEEIKKYKEVNKKNFETLEYLSSFKTFAEIKYEHIKPNYIEYYDLLNYKKSSNVVDSEFFIISGPANTNEIGLINLDTLEFSKKIISDYVNRGLAIICTISKDKLFIYGGLNHIQKAINDGYIIDIYKGTSRKIKKDYNNSYTEAVLKNNFIYIFGGLTEPLMLLSTSRSYNLKSNRWKELVNLPVASFQMRGSQLYLIYRLADNLSSEP